METLALIGVSILLVLGLALWVAAFIHAAIQADGAWAAVGRSRVRWVVLLFLFGWIAGIVYLLLVRPQLRAVVMATTRAGREPEQQAGAPGAAAPLRRRRGHFRQS